MVSRALDRLPFSSIFRPPSDSIFDEKSYSQVSSKILAVIKRTQNNDNYYKFVML